MILAVLYLFCVIVHFISYFAMGETGEMVVAISNVVCLTFGVALALTVIA